MNKTLYKKYSDSMKRVELERTQPKIEAPILLVDGLNLFIRSFCVVPTMNKMGIHTGGVYGSLMSIKYAINTFNPSRAIVIFDGRGGSARRRKMYPDYKAGRKGLKGLNRTVEWESEEAEEKSCISQLNRFIEYLTCLPVTSVNVDNIEADDAIAYICQSIYPNNKKVIMSTDKDFYQLTNEKTYI
jgi:5'-3' exonuclease